MSIGEVAAATGMRTSAIRYYEEEGLLPKADRVSGRRRYHAEAIDRLRLIRFCSRLGIGLGDIRGLLTDSGGPHAKESWRRLVDGQLEEIGQLVEAAHGVERILRESRDCDCVTLASCRFLSDERAEPPSARGARFRGARESRGSAR
jgi:MerR family transcriptional regulator, redox-sensitive transcriptional activator SoxR